MQRWRVAGVVALCVIAGLLVGILFTELDAQDFPAATEDDIGIRATQMVVVALLGWLFLTVGSERIEVEADGQGGGTLYAGRARLPFDAISRTAVVPATAKQAAMGRQLDPEAFVVHRGYIPTMVIVVLDDPMDPTPYWLLSTRYPEGLAAALPDNDYT